MKRVPMIVLALFFALVCCFPAAGGDLQKTGRIQFSYSPYPENAYQEPSVTARCYAAITNRGDKPIEVKLVLYYDGASGPEEYESPNVVTIPPHRGYFFDLIQEVRNSPVVNMPAGENTPCQPVFIWKGEVDITPLAGLEWDVLKNGKILSVTAVHLYDDGVR